MQFESQDPNFSDRNSDPNSSPLDPSFRDPTRARLQAAYRYIELSRYTDAIAALREHLAHDPEHATAHSLLAVCLREQGESREALEEARRGVHLDPESSYGLYVLALIHGRDGKLDIAHRVLEEGLRLNPVDPDLWELQAEIHLLLVRPEQATEAARQGLAYDPEHLGCLNIYARSLLETKRPDEAVEVMESALRFAPEHAATHSTLGQALLAVGRIDQARLHLQEALRLDPTQKTTRKRFNESLRARSGVFRFLRPILLKTDALFEDDGTAARVMVGGAVALLVGGALQSPDLRPLAIPFACIVVPLTMIVLFARPLMNYSLRSDPLTQESLTHAERMGAAMVPAATAWLFGALASLWLFEDPKRALPPALSLLGWAVLFVTSHTQEPFARTTRLKPWLIAGAAAWLGLLVAQLVGALGEIKSLVLPHVFLLTALIGLTSRVLTQDEPE